MLVETEPNAGVFVSYKADRAASPPRHPAARPRSLSRGNNSGTRVRICLRVPVFFVARTDLSTKRPGRAKNAAPTSRTLGTGPWHNPFRPLRWLTAMVYTSLYIPALSPPPSTQRPVWKAPPPAPPEAGQLFSGSIVGAHSGSVPVDESLTSIGRSCGGRGKGVTPDIQSGGPDRG